MSKRTLALSPKYYIYYILHVFNIFGVMYVILMLHACVTILRGLTGLILWHIYRILMSNGNAPPTKMTISF